MTKAEAAEKVAKMRRLAEKAGTPAEAETARQMADKLAREHGLTEVELSMGSRAAAFDDLIGRLDAYVKKNEVPSAVFEVIERIKKDTQKEDKAKALEKIVGGIRLATLFFGYDKTVKGVKSTIDDVLKNHGVTI